LAAETKVRADAYKNLFTEVNASVQTSLDRQKTLYDNANADDGRALTN